MGHPSHHVNGLVQPLKPHPFPETPLHFEGTYLQCLLPSVEVKAPRPRPGMLGLPPDSMEPSPAHASASWYLEGTPPMGDPAVGAAPPFRVSTGP